MNYRQGEVLILDKKTARRFGIDIDNADLKRMPVVPDNVIREGEQSGHKHEVTGGQLHMFGENKDHGMVLNSKNGASISHPEHKTVKVEPGKHAVVIQKEYDEKKDKKVKD